MGAAGLLNLIDYLQLFPDMTRGLNRKQPVTTPGVKVEEELPSGILRGILLVRFSYIVIAELPRKGSEGSFNKVYSILFYSTYLQYELALFLDMNTICYRICKK